MRLERKLGVSDIAFLIASFFGWRDGRGAAASKRAKNIFSGENNSRNSQACALMMENEGRLIFAKIGFDKVPTGEYSVSSVVRTVRIRCTLQG